MKEIASREDFLKKIVLSSSALALSACSGRAVLPDSLVGGRQSRVRRSMGTTSQGTVTTSSGQILSIVYSGSQFQLVNSAGQWVYQMLIDSTNAYVSTPSGLISTIPLSSVSQPSNFTVENYGAIYCVNASTAKVANGTTYGIINNGASNATEQIVDVDGNVYSEYLGYPPTYGGSGSGIPYPVRDRYLSARCAWGWGDLALATAGVCLAAAAIEVPVVGQIGMAVAVTSFVSAGAHLSDACSK